MFCFLEAFKKSIKLNKTDLLLINRIDKVEYQSADVIFEGEKLHFLTKWSNVREKAFKFAFLIRVQIVFLLIDYFGTFSWNSDLTLVRENFRVLRSTSPRFGWISFLSLSSYRSSLKALWQRSRIVFTTRSLGVLFLNAFH